MLSIIIPTYNESQNILNLLNKIRDNLKTGTKVEVVVVDDNSPDGTGKLVEEYARGIGTVVGMTTTLKSTTATDYESDSHGEVSHNNDKDYSIKVIHRDSKYSLNICYFARDTCFSRGICFDNGCRFFSSARSHSKNDR